ncbi:MAG: hypothetical protein KatS3mg011_0070 [Acidimicrobiia bacterium]|nr:MAG: hypothetical protein KatS3mg011_0070 [Acidimicrobiia bacterium]
MGPAGYSSRRYALLNRWDPRHLTRVVAHLRPVAGERILEVGCGRGHLTKRLNDLGVEAVGIDVNPHAALHAVTRRVVTCRAEALPFAEGVFDGVVSVHALEHIPQLGEALDEIDRVLRPGGRAVFIYPAEPIKGIWAVPTAVILHRNPFKATTVHCQWLWPSRMRRLVEPLGWKETHHEFNLLSSPQFVSVFAKP